MFQFIKVDMSFWVRKFHLLFPITIMLIVSGFMHIRVIR